MLKRLSPIILLIALIIILDGAPFNAQARLTAPKDEFGSHIGDDYFLANYTQMVRYWRKLDQQSDRMSLVDIGATSEGRTMVMAIITSAENHRRLGQHKGIARRLAKAEGLTDEEARDLAADGKAVVWINGGIHANEVLGSQQLIETVYQLASRNDEETLRILKDVIILAAIVNPDGMEMVSDWYMREPEPSRRSLSALPRLYQKYAGHDNNRDFYMSALAESRAVNRILYREWFPQIVYDHHQTGPAGTVMFAPPFRDPFNFNFDPLVMTMLEEVGAAMHSRFAAEDKPGVTTRSGANYSAWWNGGLRTTPYFHNMIGLLTETIGGPNPIEIPFIASRQLPKSDLPSPIAPQTWRFRQSIEYSLTANRAVLDYAARNKDRILLNIYRMGQNSIERGSRDNWTATPSALNAIETTGQTRSPAASAALYRALRTPEGRDARGYIIPSDQPDFLTAVKFVNTLIWSGVTVLEATDSFSVKGKRYAAGSFVVKTAQAFRPHILDMFEPQDHPNDFAYPGAPPTPPYDNAGWTLAYQMGVRFDRILDGFDGPFEPLSEEARPPAARVSGGAPGYLFSHETNDGFVAVNRLLRSGETVYWITDSYNAPNRTWPAGTHYVPATASTIPKLRQLARDIGVRFEGVTESLSHDALRLRTPRIGLWDAYGGSTASGWTRLVLEQFEFPYTLVYAPALNAGNLAQSFDVIILVDDAFRSSPGPAAVPPEYHDRLGSVTIAETLPHLKEFLSEGGTILALGNAATLGVHLDIGIQNAWIQTVNGRDQRLPSTKLYVPGSILGARVDPLNIVAYGLPERVDLFFDQSPAFRLEAGAGNVRRVAWFDTEKPLRSGWAWGQEQLKDTAAVLEASVGKGRLVLYGPQVLFRAQPHGTFRLLFNGIYAARAEPERLR
jgi:hypothetical protein